MALDPRREGDRYDKLARQVADKPQTGDTQARLAKLLAERDRWYALADREDTRVARWTSGLAPAQRLYGDDLDVSPAGPVPAVQSMAPAPAPVASSTSSFLVVGVAAVLLAVAWRSRG